MSLGSGFWRDRPSRSLELKNWTSGKKSESSCEHDVLMEYYVRKIRKAHRGGLNDVGRMVPHV